VGSQFHPEFKSRPERPHPLFRDFIRAAKELSLEAVTTQFVMGDEAEREEAAPISSQ
jgi:hypothetical protein